MNNEKNYEDLEGCYPPRPTDSKDKTLLDLDSIILHKILIIIQFLNNYLKIYKPFARLKKTSVLTRGFLM